ncbi:MAG: hypothetical protein CMF10_00220 [Idiomarina sp.]|nr:hypothetical protein [Idiomarina sp.]
MSSRKPWADSLPLDRLVHAYVRDASNFAAALELRHRRTNARRRAVGKAAEKRRARRLRTVYGGGVIDF